YHFLLTRPRLCLFLFFVFLPRPPISTLFPYTTLFRSDALPFHLLFLFLSGCLVLFLGSLTGLTKLLHYRLLTFGIVQTLYLFRSQYLSVPVADLVQRFKLCLHLFQLMGTVRLLSVHLSVFCISCFDS